MNTATAANRKNPFPGLRPFKEDEEYLFFGRENQVDAMVDKLAATRFLAVVGTSGSGKSSLVNCGLRPALHGGLMARAGTDWRMAQFRPGSDPMRAMAQALAQKGVLFRDYQAAGLTLAEIVDTTLRMSKLGVIDIYEQAQLGEDVNLLIVVDQFEELFRYRQFGAGYQENIYGMSEEAAAFVNLLLEATAQTTYPIYVVLTMRSDFLGDCTQFSGLAERINAGQYLVPRMTREERRAAIGGPVGVGGAESSPVLLTRLVNDVGDNPDQLSILQHALNRTWNQWGRSGGGGPLDLKDYEAIGTMAQALDQHAERAYAELATARQQQICEKLFKALTDKATDPRGVRRPTTLGTLCALAAATPAEVTAVINVFRKPSRSFLMPPADETLLADTVIDISHESLMRVWERLKTWADEEAQSAHIYSRLAETAVLHREGKAGLWNDPDLQVALDWKEKNQPNKEWARRYHPDFALAMKFLDDSAAARDAAIAERDAQRKRAIRRTRLTATVFGFLFLISLIALFVANQQRVRANQQTARANGLLEDVKRNSEEAKNIAVREEQARLATQEEKKQRQISEQSANEARKLQAEADKQRQDALKQKALAEKQTARVKILEQKARGEAEEANQINSLAKEIADALAREKVDVDEVIAKATKQLEYYRKREDPRGIYESLMVLGPAYLKKGQTAQARAAETEAKGIVDSRDDPTSERLRHEIATVLSESFIKEAGLKVGKERERDLREALKFSEQAVSIQEGPFHVEDPALIPDLSNLAAVTESLGESPEAIRLRIVAIQKKAVRQESLQLVSYHNDLATFYTARGDYAKAEFRLNEKLMLERNLFAPDDPRIVATLNSLVPVLRYEKKDSEADVLVKQLQGIQGGATLLQKGTYGPEVKKLKLRLQDLGFFNGDLDENFGPATEKAVIEFQKSQGLVADGIAGERTLALLEQPGTKQVGTIEIQTELKKLGFYSGAADGSFGMRTKAALIAFQRSKGLAADGTANPETLEALGLKTPAKASSVTGQVTVEIVAQMFPGTPIDTIKANLPSFLKALEDNGLTDKEMVLVALALVRADMGNFVPRVERKSRFNTSPEGHPFDLYDNKRGNQGPPDGERFKGRGYLSITGRAYYKQFSDALGLGDQLIANPDLASEPDIAARIMISYLKSLEPGIRKLLLASDLKAVRRQWSGGYGGSEEFTKAFQTGAALLK